MIAERAGGSFTGARYLPFLDLRAYGTSVLVRDLVAAIPLIFVAVPQGVAYAIIAGLPPAMGLYAAAIPAIAGSLLRSSRYVVTGPTNAVSLLVGSIVAGAASQTGASAMEVGITLAFTVGIIQLAAGVLRLDVFVDYISTPVLLGYMSGAAVLIAVGQLPNATATKGAAGNLVERVGGWLSGLRDADPMAVALTVVTFALVLGLRRVDRRIPGAIIAMAGGTAVSYFLHLRPHGLRVVADVVPVPSGFPPLTVPMLGILPSLLPGAVACTVLSLVEGSSVARAIAARSGERVDMTAEFTGQGLANIAAAFSGGYPVGGSLSRSVLNERSGAGSRLAGVFSGVFMLLVLLVLGPLVNETPLASLAGLLFVIAADLVDVSRIRMTIRGTSSDRIAFVATLIGTWTLSLDQAIYLGVGIILVLFLQRARLLTMRELAISEKGRFRELDSQFGDAARPCTAIRVLNITGPVFFGVAGELDAALDKFIRDPDLRVLIVRMRQTDSLDVTTASVLEAAAQKLASRGRLLFLLGLKGPAIEFLERTGFAERIGKENIFAIEPGWFSAMESALQRALERVGDHRCGRACPFREYLALERKAARRRNPSQDWSI